MGHFKWIIVGDKKGPLFGERKIQLVTLTVRTSIGCSVITGAEASGTILFDPRTPIFGTVGSISRLIAFNATDTGNEDFFSIS